MTRLVGAALLAGLCVWCIWDPSVLAETIHAVFCRCFDWDDDRPRRDHEAAMDALSKASRR